MTSVTFRAYSELNVDKPFCIAFAAPTKSGKTYLIKQLIAALWTNEFENLIIASPTLQYEDEYDDVIKLVDPSVHCELLKTNLEMQIRKVISEQEELKRLHKEHPDIYRETHTLLILDDCIGTNLFRGGRVENVCDELSELGRHIDLSLIIVSQKLSKISLDIRQNLTCLFVFAPLHYADIERILDEYVPQEYRQLFRKLQQEIFREQYAFIIIDGSPDRRVDFRLRIRKGFTDYIFDPTIPIDVLKTKYLLSKNKN